MSKMLAWAMGDPVSKSKKNDGWGIGKHVFFCPGGYRQMGIVSGWVFENEGCMPLCCSAFA